MEMADVIASNKCDGDRTKQAEQSAIELQGALQWSQELKIIGSRLQISALRTTGMEDNDAWLIPASQSTKWLDG